MQRFITLRGDKPSQAAISPLASLRNQGKNLVFSIVMFLIAYFLVMAMALGLAFAFGFLGFQFLKNDPGLISLFCGGGMIFIGASIIYFMVKFIFSVTKDENPMRMEIRESDHPQLFSFLKELTTETQTRFPKKIFLSADVNARVFYDSSFWSMFFPVRKNLEIGMGLVNCINRSEFRAIMAHEFAHFSQGTMKLGTFTYNVNRVMNDLLYNNTDYEEFLKGWGKMHGVLAICAGVTVRISRMIQWALRNVHHLINKNYLALSRQMEFEADRIAAQVAGSNNLINALARVRIATDCYNEAILHIADFARTHKATRNIFSNQFSVLRFMGNQYQLPIIDGLPDVSYNFFQWVTSSRVQYDDQHASHPSIKERKERLDSNLRNQTTDTISAWTLFTNVCQLQESMTAILYQTKYDDEVHEMFDQHYYEKWLREKKEKNNLPSLYKGFYDNRLMSLASDQIDHPEHIIITRSFKELFNEDHARIQKAISANESDLKKLFGIKQGLIEAAHFRFDGKTYKHADLTRIIGQLQKETADLLRHQRSLDMEAYAFFYFNSSNKEKLKADYINYHNTSEKYAGYLGHFWEAMEIINRFSAGIAVQQAIVEADRLMHMDQQVLKPIFKNLVNEGLITAETSGNLLSRIEIFSDKHYQYFFDESFLHHEVSELHILLLNIASELNRHKYALHHQLVNNQLKGLRNFTGIYIGQ